MKIGIDARCLESQRGGVARYLTNMLKIWPKTASHHRYVLYFTKQVPGDDFLRNPVFDCKVIPGPAALKSRQVLVDQILLPLQMRHDDLDVFFATWYYAPLYCPARKTVVAAWDISYTTHRKHYRFKEGLRLSLFSRISCQRAAGVVTCSPYDGRQIEKYYKVPAERICVIQLAPDEKFQPVTEPHQLDVLRKKYRIPNRYLLSMGVIFSRRNVDVIIDAFTDVHRDFPDMDLVVVGRNKTVPFVDIESRMQPLIKAGRGHYLPWIAEEDLPILYAGAWYYICTSTVDGESIMMKEAMKCGTPVITSPLMVDSVDGNVEVLENPESREETAKLLRRIIPSSELRDRQSRRGLKWVQPLSWENVARQNMTFFETR